MPDKLVSIHFKAISDSTSAVLATSEASVVHTISSGLSRVSDAHHSSFALHVTHTVFFLQTHDKPVSQHWWTEKFCFWQMHKPSNVKTKETIWSFISNIFMQTYLWVILKTIHSIELLWTQRNISLEKCLIMMKQHSVCVGKGQQVSSMHSYSNVRQLLLIAVVVCFVLTSANEWACCSQHDSVLWLFGCWLWAPHMVVMSNSYPMT